MKQRIPAISIRQPWAHLILIGVKEIEIRGWQIEYRGPMWLHSPKVVDRDGIEWCGAMYRTPMKPFWTGGYVGLIEVVGMTGLGPDAWTDLRGRHLCPGRWPGVKNARYGWIVRRLLSFEQLDGGPVVSARGGQRIFYPSPTDERKLRKLASARLP
jgi:hypothetical protein